MKLDALWWNLVAPLYDLQGKLEEATLDAVIDLADIGPDDRLLDAGCGTGLLTRRLQARGIEAETATSVDRSARMLARVPAGTSKVCADLRDLPFPDASFDAVVSTFVLHTLSDADQRLVAAELARVAASGARVVVACPYTVAPNSLRARVDARLPHGAWRAINGLTPLNPSSVLAAAGLNVVSHVDVTSGYQSRCALARVG